MNEIKKAGSMDKNFAPIATSNKHSFAMEMIEKYEAESPWNQQVETGESLSAYNRFMSYLQAGLGRSMLRVYEIQHPDIRGEYREWMDNAYTFHWKERVQAWDEYQALLGKLEWEREREEWREKRRNILDELYSQTDNIVNKIKSKLQDENDKTSVTQLLKILQVLLEQSREEYGDKQASTKVEINQRKETIQIRTIEVRKDYGADDMEMVKDINSVNSAGGIRTIDG